MQKFKNLSIEEYDINPKFTLDSETLKLFDCQTSALTEKPYEGLIKIVKEATKARTPVEKTKCIETLISQVEYSIAKFYQDNKINSLIHLDADNAIAILLYILVQSEQSQLLTHLNIVYNFLSKESLEGSLKFCLDTVKVCLQFLEKGNIKRSKGFNVEENDLLLWINTKNYFENILSK
jgi:hypothetical protein